MYVCLCHAITDCDVRQALLKGAANQADIFHHFGVEPLCGRCRHALNGFLPDHPSPCCDAVDCPLSGHRP